MRHTHTHTDAGSLSHPYSTTLPGKRTYLQGRLPLYPVRQHERCDLRFCAFRSPALRSWLIRKGVPRAGKSTAPTRVRVLFIAMAKGGEPRRVASLNYNSGERQTYDTSLHARKHAPAVTWSVLRGRARERDREKNPALELRPRNCRRNSARATGGREEGLNLMPDKNKLKKA